MSDWTAFAYDENGFVVSTHEEWKSIMSHFPDEMAIDSHWGDVYPTSIVVVKDSAYPQPQSPGSEILRAPSSWNGRDVAYEEDTMDLYTADELKQSWARAVAIAKGLQGVD